MRTDIFITISTVVLACILLLRGPAEETYIPQPGNTIALGNIVIAPENKEELADFELVGISLQVPDSESYFEPFFYTPEAGVKAAVDRAFALSSYEWEHLSDAVFVVVGKYKGEDIYFPFSLENLTNTAGGSSSKYVLSVELNDIAGGSPDPVTPCDSDAFDVQIASL